MTAIDSGYIQSCPLCGAALMPENRSTHSEWHAEQRVALHELAEALDRLDRWAANVEDVRREALERGV